MGRSRDQFQIVERHKSEKNDIFHSKVATA
jgi:hypothetical protein